MHSAGQSNYDKCVLSAQIFADKITDSWLLLGFQRLFGWVPYSLPLCSSELCHFSTAFFCNEIHQKICISFNIISWASPNNTLLQTPQKASSDVQEFYQVSFYWSLLLNEYFPHGDSSLWIFISQYIIAV